LAMRVVAREVALATRVRGALTCSMDI